MGPKWQEKSSLRFRSIPGANEMAPINKEQFLRELNPEELRQVYDRAKQELTADALQRLARMDPGIPLDQVLNGLETEKRRQDF